MSGEGEVSMGTPLEMYHAEQAALRDSLLAHLKQQQPLAVITIGGQSTAIYEFDPSPVPEPPKLRRAQHLVNATDRTPAEDIRLKKHLSKLLEGKKKSAARGAKKADVDSQDKVYDLSSGHSFEKTVLKEDAKHVHFCYGGCREGDNYKPCYATFSTNVSASNHALFEQANMELRRAAEAAAQVSGITTVTGIVCDTACGDPTCYFVYGTGTVHAHRDHVLRWQHTQEIKKAAFLRLHYRHKVKPPTDERIQGLSLQEREELRAKVHDAFRTARKNDKLLTSDEIDDRFPETKMDLKPKIDENGKLAPNRSGGAKLVNKAPALFRGGDAISVPASVLSKMSGGKASNRLGSSHTSSTSAKSSTTTSSRAGSVDSSRASSSTAGSTKSAKKRSSADSEAKGKEKEKKKKPKIVVLSSDEEE